MRYYTCSAQGAWHSTCSHKKSHGQSTHSGRRANRRPECGGKTGAGTVAPTEAYTGEAEEPRPASMAAVGSSKPTDRRDNSRACWDHCGEPTAESTRMRLD